MQSRREVIKNVSVRLSLGTRTNHLLIDSFSSGSGLPSTGKSSGTSVSITC